MQELSNQYAAMPSLHIGWALWCTLAIYPVVRRRAWRIAAVAYPFATLFAIVVTANHYWIDAVGGAAVLALGYVVGPKVQRFLPGLKRAPELQRHPTPEVEHAHGDTGR